MTVRYFDHNATTPLADAARDAWLDASQRQWLNPSSPYRSAAAVRVRLEAARESLAARFGVEPGRLVFTSGATEANNAVLRTWLERLPAKARVGISPTEHPSVVEAGKALFAERVEWLGLGPDGLVDLQHLGERLRSGELAAVSVMAANNETGVIQPWAEIAALCAGAGIPYHCDASQWVGKLPLDGLSACSFVTACGHKFGGPKGIGCMLLPGESGDFRILSGGAQEKGHRAGTEDVAGALAMLAALEASAPGDPAGRDVFTERVQATIPGTRVVAAGAPRLWNTASLIMPAHSSVRWIRALEKAGFLISAGSACATGKAAVSPVLLEMGIDPVAAGRVLRISSGADTTKEDWQALAEAFAAVRDALDRESDASNSSVISIG